ncbi:hypothetical protein DY218_15675 [Streptomyces triticagri]|uniref:Lipoprotein n=1 Tax=Streptomyces triticagri TaxID=2293568 RepID=A0A372M4L8_9ACTN|nr:hypothetical protein DY218_15675 [Streptomyces triticagri]
MVQQRRSGRGATAAVVASGVSAALILGTTGCSGDGAAADDQRAADPVDTVRAAADRLVRAGSSKARTSMEMASGGTRVTIRGEGAYDFKRRLGRLEVLLPQDPAGADEHRPITELLAPGALYMKNRGAGVPADKWVRIDTTTLSDGNLVTGGATDPLAAAELLRGARQVTYEGTAELAGARVRHYRGTAEIGRAARLAPEPGQRPLRAAAKGFATEVVPFDAYLDDAGRLRKVRHRFSFANGAGEAGSNGSAGSAGASGQKAVEVASTTLLFDFGVAVRARLPESGDIYAGKIAEQ